MWFNRTLVLAIFWGHCVCLGQMKCRMFFNKEVSLKSHVLTDQQAPSLLEASDPANTAENKVQDRRGFRLNSDSEDQFKPLEYLDQTSHSSFRLNHAILTNEMELQLYSWTQQDRFPELKAKGFKLLLDHNLRLIYSIAKKYLNKGLSFQSLIQEGALGFLIAIEKFDPTKGARLSSYSVPWIHVKMDQAIINSLNVINLPINYARTIRKVMEMETVLIQKNQRAVSYEEISRAFQEGKYDEIRTQKAFIDKKEKLGDEVEQTDNTKEDYSNYTPEFIRRVYNDSQLNALDINSFQDRTHNINSIPWQEMSNTKKHEDLIFEEELKDHLTDLLSRLTEREQFIVTLRFGIGISREFTYEEIGEILGVTKSAIQQTQLRALDKLKKYGSFVEIDELE